MLEELPPKPKKPDDDECCGRHCEPCIMDYYQRALDRWEKKVATIKAKKQRIKSATTAPKVTGGISSR